MSNFKKCAYLLTTAVILTAIFPFLSGRGFDKTEVKASAEILFKKNVNGSAYGISRQYITWRDYRDGAYNIYVYNFADKSEMKINKQALSVDAVGPYLYQRYVYWIDHLADGWSINRYDTQTGTARVLRKADARLDMLAIADAYIVYIARTNDSNYNQLFLMGLSDLSERALTDGKTWIADAAVFDKTVVWTQYPAITVFQGDNPKGDIMRYEIEPLYASVLIGGLIHPSSARLLGTTLAFTSRVSGQEVISIYYLNTGTRYQLTSADYSAKNPLLADQSIVYAKESNGKKQIVYFKFGENKFIDLAGGTNNTSAPAVSFDGKLVLWSDDRLGTNDLYYYDFNANAEDIDQDNDGLSDAQEQILGTLPYDADTDNDGLADGLEVNRYHTKPTKWDTDSDGLSDGEEVLHWMTNPLQADSNSNGLSDMQDLKTGFNPVTPTQQFTSYAGVMRWPGLGDEYKKSEELRDALNALLGAGHWRARGSADWFKMVNAYIYGDYSAEEVASYARGNSYALSANTPAEYWRAYQAGLGHSTTAYISSGKNLPVQKSVPPKQYQTKKSAPKNLPKVYSSAEVTPAGVKNAYKATYYLLP